MTLRYPNQSSVFTWFVCLRAICVQSLQCFSCMFGQFPVVFVWLFTHKRKRKIGLRSTHTVQCGNQLEELKKNTSYSFLFYFRLAHVLFGLLMWSVSYPKLKGKWTKIEAAWQQLSMCTVMCKSNFCEAAISGMHLHRKSIISQALHL